MIALQIAEYLEDNSIGVVGSGIFAEFLPDAPDNAVVIFSTGGITESSSAVLGYDKPTVQVRVRNTSQLAAYTAASVIYSLLQGARNFTLPDGTLVTTIQALQTHPVNIGRDAKQRCEYTQNYFLEIRNPTLNRG
jgi:hypothetical protein